MSGRVLVVDDVATNRLLLRAKLSSAYYDVVVAENGAQALELARSEQPDMVMLDVMMPDMDGFAVCAALKASERHRAHSGDHGHRARHARRSGSAGSRPGPTISCRSRSTIWRSSRGSAT